MLSDRPFTQEDPIGIAGGLNLYGYAGGDPINFSDPFGLCPKEERDADGKCPGGLAPDEWDTAVEQARRVLALSNASNDRAEYGVFVQSNGRGQGYPHSRVWGGGSPTRTVGSPYYGNSVPSESNMPGGVVAFVHSHPAVPNRVGGFNSSSIRGVSDGDLAMGRRNGGLVVFWGHPEGFAVLVPGSRDPLVYPWR